MFPKALCNCTGFPLIFLVGNIYVVHVYILYVSNFLVKTEDRHTEIEVD